jgi:23S rRNA pseudouridine2605 synthase
MYPAAMTEPTAASGDATSPATIAAPKGDRIAKLLARAGIASRREIERMIAEGRVALDGTVLDTPATILTSLRGVTVDGDPVAAPEAARLFLYHKPTGLLVTERDPAGRPTIYDRLPADLPRTVPVGRLDLNTEGLLLLTTDGGLKRQLELPATGVERTYRARTYGTVTQAMLEDLIEGIEIDGIRYGPIDANLERRTGANQWIELTLTEGKNREVRRVLEHLGLQVGRLIRTRYGPFILADLPPGEVGEVKQHELVAFTKTLAGTKRPKGADLQSPVTVEARAKAPATTAPSPAPRSDREPDRPLRRVAPAAWPTPPRPAQPRPATGGWGSRTRPSRPADTANAKPARGQFRLSDDRSPRTTRQPEAERSSSPRTTDQHRQRYAAADRPHGDRDARPPRMAEERPRRAAPARFAGQHSPRDDAAPSHERAVPGDKRQSGPRASAPFGTRPPRSATDPRRTFGNRPDREDHGRSDRTPTDRGRPPRDAAPRSPSSSGHPARGRADHDRTDRPARPFADRGAKPGAPARAGKGPSGGRGHPPRPPKGSPKGGPKAPGRGKR